nr:hypothetical protein [uncultured Actinotalea sp.]
MQGGAGAPRTARRRTAGTVSVLPAGLLVGLLGALLAACAASGAPSAGTPTRAVVDGVAEDLAAEIRQSRSDWGVRRVQVRLRNDGDAPVDVATATLTTSVVSDPVTSDPARGRPVPPGRYRDFPVDLGPPVCPEQDAPSAEVVVRTADGGEARLTPQDPQGHLRRVNAEDCAEQRVRAAVRLELGPDVAAEERDGRLIGALTLTATSTDPDVEAGVTRVDGTVLLSPLGATAWEPAELAALAGRPGTARLEFLPGRCDPHAVAEDKRGTFLPVHVSLDGVPQPTVYLPAPDPLRGRIYDHLAAACGW